MPKLPQIKYRDVEKVHLSKGFIPRPTKSSHVVFNHSDGRHTVVPIHNQPLPKGTLRAILRQSKISVEEFLEEI